MQVGFIEQQSNLFCDCYAILRCMLGMDASFAPKKKKSLFANQLLHNLFQNICGWMKESSKYFDIYVKCNSMGTPAKEEKSLSVWKI